MLDPNVAVYEFSIIKTFIINLIQLIKNKVALSKNFYIAPSEIDRMYYWEYEYFLEEVNNTIKAENERNEKENSKYNKDYNPSHMMKHAQNNVPKYSAPKMPKI